MKLFGLGFLIVGLSISSLSLAGECGDAVVEQVFAENLSDAGLKALIVNTFAPREGDKILYVTDLPRNAEEAKSIFWQNRLDLVEDWAARTQKVFPSHSVQVLVFENTGRHNGDLPANGYLFGPGEILPRNAIGIKKAEVPLVPTVSDANIVMAINEWSITGLVRAISTSKNFSRDFQAASMPGFHRGMIAALGIDYSRVQKYAKRIEDLLNLSQAAEMEFEVVSGGKKRTYRLHVDLTGPRASSEGGVTHNMGNAPRVVNLPSGEAWRVPNESQLDSKTEGIMPLQLNGSDEVLLLRLKKNRVVEVLSQGEQSEAFRQKISEEPLFANLAEFGAGVLQPFDVEIPKIGPPRYPISNTLLIEKLFIHLAFGVSKHLDGTVGNDDFVVKTLVHHTDHVYLPSSQPNIRIRTVKLLFSAGESIDLVTNGAYAPFVLAP